MRYLFIVFLMPLFCVAQDHHGEILPLVNHSYKIDSLLKDVLPKMATKLSKDSCVSIGIENSSYNTLFIILESKAAVNGLMNINYFNNYHLGYYEFRGFKIFVYSSKSFDTFFSQTGRVKKIDYLDFSRKKSSPETISPSTIEIIPPIAKFAYEKGKFISW